MATTFELIKGETLTGSQASYTFSAIPSTYTDLCLKASARADSSYPQNAWAIKLNGLGTSIYSYTTLRGDGASATSSRNSTTEGWLDQLPAATATSNTFSNSELYIPNYTGSAQKPLSVFNAQENNSSTAYLSAIANLVNLTSAVTSITVYPLFSAQFVTGSSFYLYGIKNS